MRLQLKRIEQSIIACITGCFLKQLKCMLKSELSIRYLLYELISQHITFTQLPIVHFQQLSLN